jgi:hypothetical protein
MDHLNAKSRRLHDLIPLFLSAAEGMPELFQASLP